MIKKQDVPEGWTKEAADFINKVSGKKYYYYDFNFKFYIIFQCLARKASSRLGFNGNKEVKNHPWFDSIDWHAL